MATRQGDEEGRRSPDPDGPSGIPGLPPDWGNVVVPDDPAELAVEAEQIRRELRRDVRRRRWGRYLDRLAGRGLGTPLLIMGIALTVALASLLAVAWPSTNTPKAAPSEPEPGVPSRS